MQSKQSKDRAHVADVKASGRRGARPAAPGVATESEQTHPASALRRAVLSPHSLTPRDALRLQQAVGNRATGRLLTSERRSPDRGGDGPSEQPRAARESAAPAPAAPVSAPASGGPCPVIQRKVGFEFEMSIPVSPKEAPAPESEESSELQQIPEWYYATRPVAPKTVLLPRSDNEDFYVETDHDAVLTKALENPQPNVEIITKPIEEFAENWQELLSRRAKAILTHAAWIASKDPQHKRTEYDPTPQYMIGYPAEEGFAPEMEAARAKVSTAAYVQATVGLRTEALPGILMEEGTAPDFFGDEQSRLVNLHAGRASAELDRKLRAGELLPSMKAKGVDTAYQSLSPPARQQLMGLFALIDSYLIGGVLNYQEEIGKNIVGLLGKTDLAEIRRKTLGAEASGFVKTFTAEVAYLLLSGANRSTQETALSKGHAPAKGNPPPYRFVAAILLGKASDFFTGPNVETTIPAEKVGPGAEAERATGGVYEFRAIPGHHDPSAWPKIMEEFVRRARKWNTLS